MASTSQATQNNNKLFPLYSKKLASDDPTTYATFADKLSVWLSSERAYYSNARPEIVKLLLTAQATLRRAVGADANAPFHISSFYHHPMTAPYARLVGVIRPYYNLFKEKELRARVKLLLYSISAPRPQPTVAPPASSISPSPATSMFKAGEAGAAAEHLPVTHVNDPNPAMQSSSSSLALALFQMDPPHPPSTNASITSSHSTPLHGKGISDAVLPGQAAAPVVVSHPLPQIPTHPQYRPPSAPPVTPAHAPSQPQPSGDPCTSFSIGSTPNDTQVHLPSVTPTENTPALAKPKAKKKIKADLKHLLELDVKGYLQKKENAATQPLSSTADPSSAMSPQDEEKTPNDYTSTRKSPEAASSEQLTHEPKRVQTIEPTSASITNSPSIPAQECSSTAVEPGEPVDAAESPTVLSLSVGIKQKPQNQSDPETILMSPLIHVPSSSGGGDAMDADSVTVPVDGGSDARTAESEDILSQPSIPEMISAANVAPPTEDVVMDDIQYQRHKEIATTHVNNEEGDSSVNLPQVPPQTEGGTLDDGLSLVDSGVAGGLLPFEHSEGLSSAPMVAGRGMEDTSVLLSSPRLLICPVSTTPTGPSEILVDTTEAEIRDGSSDNAVLGVASEHEVTLDLSEGNSTAIAGVQNSGHLSTEVATDDPEKIADGEDVDQYNSLAQSMQEISLPLTQPEVTVVDCPTIDATKTPTTVKSTESFTSPSGDGHFFSQQSSSLTHTPIDVNHTPDPTAVESVNNRKRLRTPSRSEAGPVSVVRPRISHSPQPALLGATGPPTDDDDGAVSNARPPPVSSIAVEQQMLPEQNGLPQSKSLLNGQRTKPNLTVDTDRATLSLSSPNITWSNITPPITNENANGIEGGEVLSASIFGPEMRVIAIQQGSTAQGTITIEFSMNQDQLDMISKWSNWTRTTENVKESLCLSLACYSSAELLALIRKSARTSIEQLICEHRSLWPKNGGLSMKINYNGSLETFPLSPPFAVTPDNLVDVSQFMTLGKNTIELNQRRDMSTYTFFLHAHYPTSAQLQQVARRRKKDQSWRDWLRQASQPLDVPLEQLH